MEVSNYSYQQTTNGTLGNDSHQQTTNGTLGTPLQFDDEREYYFMLAEDLSIYARPFLLFLGVLGNSLSVILMKRGPFKQSSTGVYLFFLSFSDLCKCLYEIIIRFSGFILNENAIVCKVFPYLTFLFSDVSSWMVVAVTGERAIVIALPHKAKVISTRKRAWIVSSCIIVVLSLINIRLLFSFVLIDGDCSQEGLSDLLGGIFAMVDLLKFSAIPSVVLIICNVFLTYKLKQSQSFRQSIHGESDDNDTRRVVIMVLLVSAVFVVLTFPLSCFLISDFVPPESLWDPVYRELLFELCVFLFYINHSINFFLYFISAPKFRRELLVLFRCVNNLPNEAIGASNRTN